MAFWKFFAWNLIYGVFWVDVKKSCGKSRFEDLGIQARYFGQRKKNNEASKLRPLLLLRLLLSRHLLLFLIALRLSPLEKVRNSSAKKHKKKIVCFLEATRENKRKKLASPRAVIAQESAHHSGRTRSSWTHRSLHRLQVLPISRFFFSLHIFLWFFPSLAKRFFWRLGPWHCFHCFVYVIQTYCLLVAVENKRRFPSPMVLPKLRRIHGMIFSSVTSCLRRRCAFSLITEPWYMCLQCYRVLSCKALAQRFS